MIWLPHREVGRWDEIVWMEVDSHVRIESKNALRQPLRGREAERTHQSAVLWPSGLQKVIPQFEL